MNPYLKKNIAFFLFKWGVHIKHYCVLYSLDYGMCNLCEENEQKQFQPPIGHNVEDQHAWIPSFYN